MAESFKQAIQKGLDHVLPLLGFQLGSFWDGEYWYIMPDVGSDAACVIGKALGYEEGDIFDLPDGFEIIFQVDKGFSDWSYVWGADVDHVTEKDAIGALCALWTLKYGENHAVQ